MSPGTHLLFSWVTTVELLKNRRERAVVSVAGIAPDIDGIGIIVDKITGSTNFYISHHHYFGHSIFAAFLIAILAACISKVQRAAVFFLSFLLVHVHILFDVIGSKGPDGYQWPVYYLFPVIPDFNLTWSGQWELNSWQNHLVMLVLVLISVYYAATKKITFFEVFSSKLNQEVFNMYKKYVQRST